MKANFSFALKMHLGSGRRRWLDNHAKHLASLNWSEPGRFRKESELPEGFEKYHAVDVLGTEFAWMNETFSKEKFKWYLWFESVFLVPEEMVPFLVLRWS